MDDKLKGSDTPGNSDAFDQVVAEYGSMLWRTATTYERNPDLRRELYQEILVAVWKALPRFREAANLRTYLARIAHNRGVTHVNSEVRQPIGTPLDPEFASNSPTPAEEVEAYDRRKNLLAKIQRMPLVSRQVVTLTLEGFAPREIAAVLGLSANVVSIRLSRAKKDLRIAVTADAE